VQAKRARKAKTRTNQKYLKMSRKQLENFLEQERRITLGSSITRFSIDADASDEERASLKREAAIEKLNRASRRRAAKRKLQRKQNLKLKLEAEHEVAHIDEMLKFESGSKVKMGRKARHQMTAKLGKAERKAVKMVPNSKQKEAGNGKSTMAKWLSSASASGTIERRI
jgi:hypothetical protein